ncbi:MAG: hypothetical protein K9K67_01270 [Bacteriovoracaceae bacterium]|nr:hypothetical protein [Bacteriovoracaceae bacterium]
MEGFETAEDYILYIQWASKLDNDFIHLAARLRQANVSLVPVKPNEIDFFLSKRKVPVIILTKTIAQYHKLLECKKRHFDFYLKSGRISILHLTSFKEVQDYASFKPKKDYIVLKLPLMADDIISKVLNEFSGKDALSERWPGGRRARLPQMGGES